jgi:peroxiredoxin
MSTAEQTIAAQVEAMQAGMAGQLPPEAEAAFDQERAELAAAGLPNGVTIAGAPMPDGALLDATGTPTTLEQTRSGAPAVAVFYRGAWCPFCNVALRAYEQQLAGPLAAQGVKLIAISPQKPDGSLTMKEKHELSFDVLSDPGNQIASQLGIVTGPSDSVRAAQQSLGLDVTQVNADGTTAMPMPTVTVIDAAGTIQWIDVHPDYGTRSEPEDVLAAVAALNS